jgi:transglutaminase-like putative cysteine protease
LLLSRDFFIDYHVYLGGGTYTTIDANLNDRVMKRPAEQPIYEFLQELNQHVYHLLEFDPEPTHVHTTVSEVMGLGRGVCQDYTHLFIAVARQNRIPCRYVSGYLNQGGSLVGSAQMHAWAEAYVPGYGWQGFDPTNNLLADINHIKTAHGTDYSDCSPLKGMLKTSGGHKTTYGVKVIQNQQAQESQ